MLRISLEQWRMFHAVVEFGGFNQASKEVYKSQSSIHNAVGKIEASLGIKLFVIEGRKTVLTEEGKLILKRSRYLLEEANKVEAIGSTLSQGVESILKIAVDEVFPRQLLYKTLESVSQQYPLVQIELFESILNGANEMLERQEVDIAISPNSLGIGMSESLGYVNFCAVAASNHPLHKIKDTLTLENLKTHRQIVVRDSVQSKEKINDGWLDANQRWTVSHMQSSIDMITQGLGFAWLPMHLIETQIDNGLLKRLQLNQYSERFVPLYLTVKDSDCLGRVAQSFLSELKDYCKDLPLAPATSI